MLNINTKEIVKIKIDDTEYDLSPPTFEAIESYQDDIADLGEDDPKMFEIMKTQLLDCGLPEAILKKLQMRHILSIIKVLTEKKD